MSETLQIFLAMSISFIAMIIIIIITIIVTKKRIHKYSNNIINELNLEIFYRKKVQWLKGNHRGREYWLTFTKKNSYDPLVHHNRPLSILTLLCDVKSADKKVLFDNLVDCFHAKKTDIFLELSKNNFYSDKIIIGLYDSMYKNLPLPPFLAQGKYIIKLYLNSVPNNKSLDVIEALEKINSIDK